MTYLSHYLSPLGPMTLASDGEALIGLWFDGQKYDRATLPKGEIVEDEQAHPEDSQREWAPILQAKRWLDTYFSGQQPTFTPPLRLTGSAFRQRVYEILLTIPYGHTVTYGEIAQIIASERQGGSPLPLSEVLPSLSSEGLPSVPSHRGSQAVGGAVGHNPISLIIPCHRVLGSNHTLTGYAGGLDAKRWLLQHEQQYSMRLAF